MNRLAGETSPYLQQHAANPVEWYPWGEEALMLAQRENRPILLSIGYSACHWCHVMAHESFEDPSIAELMNGLFVNVKVDREERPDLDQIYQSAHAMLTRRSGGWPLTMFLTPSQEPFFGGTYFPKTSRYGLIGFAALLPKVAEAYREQGSAIAEQNARLVAALRMTNPNMPDAAASLPPDAAERAIDALSRSFDPVHGGFGAAPKFPHATELDLCLRHHALHQDLRLREVVEVSLARMADGGICDQLAGGFCRYSVDADWTIPHFEKMLYDNAALLALYADAWRATRAEGFALTAKGIVSWLSSEMRSPEKAFYSSLDADSEHEEGKFYVWTRDEVRALLSADEYAVAAAHWGLDEPPNFEGESWNLRVVSPLPDVARTLSITLAEAHQRIESSRTKLLQARAARVRPGRDDKLLTSWNALMIAALARAGRALHEPAWVDAAREAADFIRDTMWRDGKLLATCKDGRAHLNAYLDDHAFMLAALIEMMQSAFRARDLEWATEIADSLLARFEDAQGGGFFFTSHDHEALIHRPKPGHDNATPAGNGIAAQALNTLGHWLSEPRYLDAAERTVRAFARDLAEQPTGFASLLVALDACTTPPTTVLLRGDAATCASWHRSLERSYRPSVQSLDLSGQRELPGALAKPHLEKGGPGSVTASVCRGMTCLPAIHSLPELEAAISDTA
ncbi:MAG: thioredoxin domain-containing protein [Pseudomonadota bacterium]|nr:thioredoxin domain-containing protein [Pseudomonadota bacterium]